MDALLYWVGLVAVAVSALTGVLDSGRKQMDLIGAVLVGVATALGVMLAISPLLGLAAMLTWIVVFAISRYSSLAAIVAAVLAPVYAWVLLSAYKDYVIAVLVMSVLLIWRHRTNIQKLLAGTEAGFGKK